MQPLLKVGDATRLGAHHDGGGVNFALFSAHADAVDLCFFSPDGKDEIARLRMPDCTHQVWNGYLEGAEPGLLYGYRVHGSYQPELGHRFNPHKLLIDPYARHLHGPFAWHKAHYAYQVGSSQEDLSFDTHDSAPHMPKCVVVEDAARTTPTRNRIDKRRSVIYEAHTKGLTMLHPGIPADQRGRFVGLGHKAIVGHLKQLGITSLELLPVHGFLDEPFLVDKGLRNYWGYNTLTFFAPHRAYLATDDVGEFRAMVNALHDANIEVILDVVYNHTAEGDRLGPTLCFRGIDNLSYYRLNNDNKRHYTNETGCGNTLNLSSPFVLRMVMDSLRYWVATMGVDGFRFDLATVLGREHYGYDRSAGFFDAIHQDPTLAAVKLIAEPWDIGPGGYQLGQFPPGWSEWNDRYRDTMRRYWRGDAGMLPDFARRLHGSSDIFEHLGRRPSTSVNFITSHDGFTLRDLVSYREKHNEANLENNRDGHSENFSANYGKEGFTDDPEILAVRRQQQRNLLATLILSQGTPMLCAGDEMGRTQLGNNNAYCQDTILNWVPWIWDSEQAALVAFTRNLLHIKRDHPGIWQDHFVHDTGNPNRPAIRWYTTCGEPMLPSDWSQHHVRTLGYMISPFGTAASMQYLTIFNASERVQSIRLPLAETVPQWRVLLSTALPEGVPNHPTFCRDQVDVPAYATLLLVAAEEYVS
jgi:isoamylase